MAGVAGEVARLSQGRLRVAVDGLTAAGKTSFGHELATALRDLGRPTLRASLDDFKNPWREASALGYDRVSGEVYYRNAYDFRSARELLLGPAGPRGSGAVLVTGLSALNGAAGALFIPASRGLIPEIVDAPRLPSANALIRLSENSASLAGAALSGVIIVAAGAGWALAIDAASFLMSAGLVLTSRAARTVHGGGRMTMFADLREGWQEFRSRQWVWVIVAQFALVNLCFAPRVYVLGPIGLLLVGPVSAVLGIERTLVAAGSVVAIGNLGALCTRSVRRLPAKRHDDPGS
jgi:Transmembrane secretion effector